MSARLILSAFAAAAALATAATGQAQSPDLAAYDAARASSPVDKLVLCDAIAFLSTRPDVANARVILARRDAEPFERLLPPDFIGGGRFYSQTAERLYWRLRSQKQASLDQVSAAQNRLARPMVRAFGRGGYLPNAFTRPQMAYCNGFARANGVRGGF